MAQAGAWWHAALATRGTALPQRRCPPPPHELPSTQSSVALFTASPRPALLPSLFPTVPKTLVMNQYGFTLFVGVLIDTFIMRSIVVPASICFLGDMPGRRVNWWPRRVPEVLLSNAAEEARLMAGHWTPVDEAPAPGGEGGEGAEVSAEDAAGDVSKPAPGSSTGVVAFA